MANNWDDMYMKMAYCAAHASKAKRRQVGAIAVKDGNIIGIGINGTPSGWITNDDTDPDTGHTCDTVLHAEENLVAKMARSGTSSVGATVYCTTAPCLKCSRLLAQSGISRVVYYEPYSDESGLVMMSILGIEVEKFDG